MVRVTVPIPGRPTTWCVGSGHDRSSRRRYLPELPGAIDGVRGGRPRGRRPRGSSRWPPSLAARGAGDGPAHRARRARRPRRCRCTRRCCISSPRRRRTATTSVIALGRGSGGRSRRLRRVDVHARRAVHPGADHAHSRRSTPRSAASPAVNLPEGKNLVGTFAQPRRCSPTSTRCATLPEREFRSGLAEVAKYALTLDVELLDMLERDPAPILARDPVTLERLVARCVAAKARTVAEDERDDGARLFLNYGHTLGHALERLDAFAGRSHGEAVAVGMVFAARLAEARGLASGGLATRTARLLASFGLETDGSLAAARRDPRGVPSRQEVSRWCSLRAPAGCRATRGRGRCHRRRAPRGAGGDGSERMKILYLFGPNLGALGTRDPADVRRPRRSPRSWTR